MSAASLDVGDKTEEEELRCSRSDDSPKGDGPGGEKGRGGRPSEWPWGCEPANASAAAALADTAAVGDDGRVGQGSGPVEEYGPEVKGVWRPLPGDTWMRISELEGI